MPACSPACSAKSASPSVSQAAKEPASTPLDARGADQAALVGTLDQHHRTFPNQFPLASPQKTAKNPWGTTTQRGATGTSIHTRTAGLFRLGEYFRPLHGHPLSFRLFVMATMSAFTLVSIPHGHPLSFRLAQRLSLTKKCGSFHPAREGCK